MVRLYFVNENHRQTTVIHRSSLWSGVSMSMALQSYNLHLPTRFSLPQNPSNKACAAHLSPPSTRRRALSLFTITTFLSGVAFSHGCSSNYSWSKPAISDFVELPNSGGVKALDLRIGDDGETPSNGDKVFLFPVYRYFLLCCGSI